MRRAAWIGLAVFVAGCGSAPAPPLAPLYPAMEKHSDSHVVIVDAPTGRRVVIYPPIGVAKPKGLMVIGAAGSNLVSGMALGEGDRPEHLPFARAGYAVAAYDVTGPMPPGDVVDASLVREAIDAFVARNAGVDDGRDAIDAGLKEFPDAAGNVIAVGHSSAGTLALSLAAQDDRVKRCIAFAPVTDVLAFFGPQRMESIEKTPALRDTVARNAPVSLVAKLKKPVFLFSAQDDSVVPTASVTAFAAKLSENGTPVELKVVPSGEHHDSMIRQGHPLALAWLAKQK